MDILVWPFYDTFEQDFKISMESLIKNTILEDKIMFMVDERLIEGTKNQIKRYVDNGIGVIMNDIEDVKKNVTEDLLIIRTGILFYAFWQGKMQEAREKLGDQYNYVPSFVNVMGEQLSVLDKMYHDNLLFDLDYNRVPVNRKNIEYFNRMCAFQWKEIKRNDDIIILYSDKSLKEKPIACVLSCAMAKLKR